MIPSLIGWAVYSSIHWISLSRITFPPNSLVLICSSSMYILTGRMEVPEVIDAWLSAFFLKNGFLQRPVMPAFLPLGYCLPDTFAWRGESQRFLNWWPVCCYFLGFLSCMALYVFFLFLGYFSDGDVIHSNI